MGRPLNKRNFGTGTSIDFTVHARLASGVEAYGYIVKQVATKRFMVNVGGTVGVCTLVDKAVGTLNAGEMTMSCRNTGGTVKRVIKIAGRVATLNDHTVTAWSFASASTGKVEMESYGDTFSTPVITISAQPTARSVVVGSTATFSVTAAVTQGATLTYQWKKGGVNITGATSASYTTPATILGDSGSVFTVVVSAVGATPVTSSNATLTVTAS